MASNVNASNVLTESTTISKVWDENSEFKIKDVTLESFKADAGTLSKTLSDIEELELKLTPLRNTRDDLSRKLNEINTRVRSGMKSYFGPNSSQYEQVGGTRSSERKPATRKAKDNAAK